MIPFIVPLFGGWSQWYSPFAQDPNGYPTSCVRGCLLETTTENPSGLDPVGIRPATCAVCAASDLGEDGSAARRWLVVADGEVFVLALPGSWGFAGPPHGADAASALAGGRLVLAEPTAADWLAARRVVRIALSDIQGCHLEPLVASGALLAETKAGPVTLIRFSSALSADFGLAARAIASLAKGEDLAIDPRDLPRYCPHCERRLQANTRVCPY